MAKCLVCDKEYNDFDPASYPPACSKECFWILAHAIDHKEASCWISLEVFCGVRSTGYCYECEVFKIEEEIKKRSLDKAILFGNY